MKKYLIFALLLGAALFYLPHSLNKDAANPTTGFLGKISSFVSSFTDSIDLKNLGMGESATEATSANVYKYQDKEGQWHFSDQGDNNRQGQTVERYDLNSNVVPGINPSSANAADTEENENTEKDEDTANNSLPSAHISPLTVYTEPEKVMKFIDKAKSLQQTIDNHKSSMDRQIDGL
ncbi:MAG: DUF4124 domain-containing protein [Thiohalomonadales bacterium]